MAVAPQYFCLHETCNALTFKQGTEVPPAGDAPLGGELSHGCLHQEHRDAARKQEEDVWDQKGT